MKTKMHLNLFIDTTLYRKLKSKLALRGQSITGWVRRMAEKETGTKPVKP